MIFGRTKLIICASKAKKYQESFANVHLSASHQYPDQNNKKRISESGKFRKKKLDVEKFDVGDRLKRVLTKFEAEWS